MEPQNLHKKTDNYNAVTDARYFAGRALQKLSVIRDTDLSESSGTNIKAAEQKLREAMELLHRETVNV